jgi:hypothetical protein
MLKRPTVPTMVPVGPAAEGTVSQAEANRPTEALTATNILRERPDGPGPKLKAPSGPTCARTQCFPGSRKRASASCTVSLARSCTVSEQVAQMRSQPEGCMASQLSPQGLGKEMRRSLIGTIVFAPPTSATGRKQTLASARKWTSDRLDDARKRGRPSDRPRGFFSTASRRAARFRRR